MNIPNCRFREYYDLKLFFTNGLGGVIHRTQTHVGYEASQSYLWGEATKNSLWVMIISVLLRTCSFVYGGCIIAARGYVPMSTLAPGSSFMKSPVISNAVIFQGAPATELSHRNFGLFFRPRGQRALGTTGVVMKQQSIVQACGIGALAAVAGTYGVQ